MQRVLEDPKWTGEMAECVKKDSCPGQTGSYTQELALLENGKNMHL